MEQLKNRIPRKFNKIVGKILPLTNVTTKDDILHIYKNNRGYLTLNTSTGEYFYSPIALLRDAQIFQVIEIS